MKIDELAAMEAEERKWLGEHYVHARVKNDKQAMVASFALMQTACGIICASIPLESLINPKAEKDFVDEFREMFRETAKIAIAVKTQNEFSQHMKVKYGDNANTTEQA